jgi:RNA polymerase sigma-70 factor (ECF subfamily)
MISAAHQFELVQQAVQGDRVALKLLLTDSHARLCERLARRLPSLLRSTVEAEDVVQEAHVEVFRRIGTFVPREPQSFDRWVLAIALSRLRNAIRRQCMLRRGGQATSPATTRKIEDSTIALLDAIAGPGRTPSRSAARHELIEAVHTALARLPEPNRKAMWLVHIEGRAVREAAAEMGRTERAVHGLCRRGVALLRAQLKSASQFLVSDH